MIGKIRGRDDLIRDGVGDEVFAAVTSTNPETGRPYGGPCGRRDENGGMLLVQWEQMTPEEQQECTRLLGDGWTPRRDKEQHELTQLRQN